MKFDILIVDDSATTRIVIRRTLGLAEIPMDNCYEASNGNDALEILRKCKVDLVLADLHMPKMDGSTMVGLMMADETIRHVPVIVVSAEPSAETLADLTRIGVRGYIRKPFTPEEIRDKVNEILGIHHE